MNGILPLWKPKGLTSHDCVMKVRKLYGIKKVGHTGTLDPGVEGVLPICIGEATKIIPFLSTLKKTYVAHIQLGIATETEDSEGKVIAKKAITSPITEAEIDRALAQFKGEITQIPPYYSAVKVKGKRLYEYARKQEKVERPKRQVTIYDIHRIKQEKDLQANCFAFKVTCSKGTYIRTLCVDIGKKLGYPAYMSYLKRTESDSFVEEETVTFEQIEKAKIEQQEKELLQPLHRGLQHLDGILVSELEKEKILSGQKRPLPEQLPKTDPFLMMHGQRLLAIYQIHPENKKEIKPIRVFNL